VQYSWSTLTYGKNAQDSYISDFIYQNRQCLVLLNIFINTATKQLKLNLFLLDSFICWLCCRLHWSTDSIYKVNCDITFLISNPCKDKIVYTRKNPQVVAILMKTRLNNVLLPTLFTVVNNIEQYCYTRFRLNNISNIVHYCWHWVWTTWAAKHCSILLSNGLGVFCHVGWVSN
jgi:hypothetical protein